MKRLIVITAMLVAALAVPARAQEQKAVAPSTLRVQLILAQYQGDKKISSLPYTLTVNPDERSRNIGKASLRVGTQVPITMMVRQGNDANAPLVPSITYRDVGTNIDCTVAAMDDGRFKLDLIVEDASVDTSAGRSPSNPAFRSFRTSDTMLLRDGQSAQFSTATDKVSGDVWKVDVTLTVVK